MDNEKLFHFLAGKIDDIKSAILYCHSNSQLRVNNTIINFSKLDDNGRIIFFINRPHQLLSQYEQEFPVSLNYFQKGKSYFMNVHGSARIVNDPEELAYYDLSDGEMTDALTSKVLVIVNVSMVDFFDTAYERKNLLLKKVWSLFSSLFDWFGSASRSYRFGEPSSVHNYGF